MYIKKIVCFGKNYRLKFFFSKKSFIKKRHPFTKIITFFQKKYAHLYPDPTLDLFESNSVLVYNSTSFKLSELSFLTFFIINACRHSFLG